MQSSVLTQLVQYVQNFGLGVLRFFFAGDILTGILVLGILATVFSNSYEVLSLFTGGVRDANSQSTALTPIYLKTLKDVCINVLFLFGLTKKIKEKSAFTLPVYFWICLFFFLSSLLLTVIHQNALTGLIAVRWFLPFLLFAIFFGSVNDQRQIAIQRALLVVFAIAFVLQVGQLLFADPYFGTNILGLSLRNPGVYLIPSSMASFTMMTLYYTFFYSRRGLIRSTVLYILGPLSIFLTGSGSGVLAIAFFYGAIAMKTLRLDIKLSAIVGIVLLGVCFLLLPDITGRENIYTSLTERVWILFNNFEKENLLFSFDMAKATNTANLLNNVLGERDKLEAFVADSTIVSLLSGIGLIGTLSFLMLYFRYARTHLQWLLFFACTFPFVLSTIAFEVFPFGMLMIISLAHLISQHHSPARSHDMWTSEGLKRRIV